MSAYINRYCERHGEWEQDVEHPDDECPACTEEGVAPSQRRADELSKLRAERDALLGLLEECLPIVAETQTFDGHTVDTPEKILARIDAALAKGRT